jgi:glycolate oxidase FAD binding subunit
VFGLEAAAAQDAMTAALSSPNEVSAAAHLPADIASRSAVGYVAGAESAVTALRIEGLEPSVEARCASLREAMAAFGQVEELHFHNSRKFWQEVGNVSPFTDNDGSVWRLSVPPAGAPSVIADICRGLDAEHFVDWGGGLVWLRIGGNEEDAGAAIIRNAIAPDGGHATLIRAPEEMRTRVPVFQPQPDVLSRLSGRIKDGYDPAHILNPGRMVDGHAAGGI